MAEDDKVGHTTFFKVQSLAHAYWATMEDGVLGYVGAAHLRHLWRELDPELLLRTEVAAEINNMFEAQRRFFLAGLKLGPLSFAWLGKHLILDFAIAPDDVEHALHDLTPPRERIVRCLGVDVGFVLAALVPLGDGGTQRVRFQLLACTNRIRAVDKSEAAPSLETFIMEVTLYMTVVTARYLPMMMKSYTMLKILELFFSQIKWFYRRAGRAPIWTLRFLPIAITVQLLLADLPKLLHSRMPMLQTRLHRRLCQRGWLKAPQDFTLRADVPLKTLTEQARK